MTYSYVNADTLTKKFKRECTVFTIMFTIWFLWCIASIMLVYLFDLPGWFHVLYGICVLCITYKGLYTFRVKRLKYKVCSGNYTDLLQVRESGDVLILSIKSINFYILPRCNGMSGNHCIIDLANSTYTLDI